MAKNKITAFVTKVVGPELKEQQLGALDILKYIGPGLLVTVGFIDPGNWASNLAAGSVFGYRLLWMVSLSTIMLIILQHNAAHLGIKTGLCISEAATRHFRPWISKAVLISAVIASIATALAELLGAAIGLSLLFHIPLKIGAVISLIFTLWMLYANAYKKLEKWIIGFVSIIGLCFLFELLLLRIEWKEALAGWITPALPPGSMVIVMSVLGAVVMPHNIFLHSEIIQSRQWNQEDEKVMERQLKYEFADTIFSMIVGWAINSAMIIVAAASFYTIGREVTDLAQAENMLRPLLGPAAAIVFSIALLCSGLSSSVTAGMAGGSIYAGIAGEPYDIRDRHTRIGVGITLIAGALAIFFISNPFKGLVLSQMFLSIQLPVTVFTLISLTSSTRVMGRFANTILEKALLWGVALIVTMLNLMLLADSLARVFHGTLF